MRKDPMTIDGRPVRDAKRGAIIHITDDDVKKGNRRDSGGCAAALAMMRELHATQARVHLARVYLLIDDEWHRYRNSAPLRQEIIVHDRDGKFAPGEYSIKPMPPNKYDYQSKKKTKPAGKPDKRVKIAKLPKHQVTGVRERGANR